MVKVQEFRGQMFITLPRQLARAKGFRKGMELEYIIDNVGQLILRQKQA